MRSPPERRVGSAGEISPSLNGMLLDTSGPSAFMPFGRQTNLIIFARGAIFHRCMPAGLHDAFTVSSWAEMAPHTV